MHPWETGRDNSPEWDAPGEPIDVSDVGEYMRRDTSHLDAKMRPTKLEYDRYLALVQFGRAMGWDQREIAADNPFRVADVGMTMILLRANRDLPRWPTQLGPRAAKPTRCAAGSPLAEPGSAICGTTSGRLVLARPAHRPIFRLRHQRVVPELLRRAARRASAMPRRSRTSTASAARSTI